MTGKGLVVPKQSEKARRDKIAADMLGVTVKELKAMRVAEQKAALARKAAARGLSVPEYLVQRRNQRKGKTKTRKSTRPYRKAPNAKSPTAATAATPRTRPVFDPVPKKPTLTKRTCPTCQTAKWPSAFPSHGRTCQDCRNLAAGRRIRFVSGGAPGLGKRR